MIRLFLAVKFVIILLLASLDFVTREFLWLCCLSAACVRFIGVARERHLCSGQGRGGGLVVCGLFLSELCDQRCTVDLFLLSSSNLNATLFGFPPLFVLLPFSHPSRLFSSAIEGPVLAGTGVVYGASAKWRTAAKFASYSDFAVVVATCHERVRLLLAPVSVG